MRWLSRQITLPVLIGISLSGISIGVLYFLYKKDEDNCRNSVRAKSKRVETQIEVLVPRQFVPMIIGRGGQTIKSIESNTSTRIRFADDNVEKVDRICYIRGERESVELAEAMIKNLIESQPLIENFDLYVPSKFYFVLVADRCQLANDIQAMAKAKIILDKFTGPNDDDKRRVILRGTAEQIALAMSLIEEKLEEFNTTQAELEVGQSSRSVRGKLLTRNPVVDAQVHSEDEPNVHEGTMEVYVSAVVSPSQFWVQVVGPGTLALDKLVKNMTTYYEDEENYKLHTLKEITIGQKVATKFSYDKKWYRAEIMDIEDDQYEVYFLDYGDHQVVGREFIVELRTDFLGLRFQAIEFSLANVSPKDEEWSEEAISRFEDLTWCAHWKVIIAKVRGYKERELSLGSSRREGSPIPCVDLFDRNDNQDINVGKQMVIENFGVTEEEGTWSTTSSTVSLSRRSHDNSQSPTPIKACKKNNNVISSSSEGFMTPQQSKRDKVVEEFVDLVTPQRKNKSIIEEIDLVTPVKEKTRKFIEAEKEENKSEECSKISNSTNGAATQRKPLSNPIPGGYENEDAMEYDELELF